MKKQYLISILLVISLLIGLILLSGCEGEFNINPEDAEKIIKCESPYMRHGFECCLDQNNNNICDKDETHCSDECTSPSCEGFDYYDCIMKNDGCKDKESKGKVIGKCGVECLSNSDCSSDEECRNYKCGDTNNYVDECSSASCDGFNYIACIKQSDGYNDKVNKGVVKNKCGVECLANSDCNSAEECKNYKCISTKIFSDLKCVDNKLEVTIHNIGKEIIEIGKDVSFQVNGLVVNPIYFKCNPSILPYGASATCVITPVLPLLIENTVKISEKVNGKVETATEQVVCEENNIEGFEDWDIVLSDSAEEDTIEMAIELAKLINYEKSILPKSNFDITGYERIYLIKKKDTIVSRLSEYVVAIGDDTPASIVAKARDLAEGIGYTGSIKSLNDIDFMKYERAIYLVTEKPQIELDLSNYPIPLFIKKFGDEYKFDGKIVVGDQAPAEDVVGAIDIATSLQYSSGDMNEDGTIKKVTVGGVKLASEILDYKVQNIISIGNPCDNKVTSDIMGFSAFPDSECKAIFEEGKAIIKLYDTGAGKFAMVVAGYSAADTRRATKVVAEYDNYALNSDEVCVIGTSMTDITVIQGECP